MKRLESESANIVGPATGPEKLVEATEVDKRGVQCRVVSHGSQCGLDLTAREAV